MFTLMFNTGARVSEIIGVRVADVVLGPTSSVRLHGKGRKQRSLPLWRTTAKALRDWLHLNSQLQADSPLLPRRDGKPMTRANVAQRLKFAVQIASQKYPDLASMSVSPHMVRHGTAMGLLQAGVDPCEIALWLGHESPATTHMYVEADLDEGAGIGTLEGAGGQVGEVPTAQGPDGVLTGTVIMRSGSCTRTRPNTRPDRHVKTTTSHKSGLRITALLYP